MTRKIAGWAFAAFVVFFVITNPTGAAAIARDAASGVSTFFTALAGGGR